MEKLLHPRNGLEQQGVRLTREEDGSLWPLGRRVLAGAHPSPATPQPSAALGASAREPGNCAGDGAERAEGAGHDGAGVLGE